MKKLLSLLLALTLVVSLVVPAMAEGEETLPLPTATVTDIEKESLPDFPLNFALKFVADEVSEDQLAEYGSWYADFVLTLTGVNEAPYFSADGTADGYLAGRYDLWDNGNWLAVPEIEGGIQVPVGEENAIKVMETAALLMGASGLKLTYNDVYSFVKEFDCGIYFTPAYLEANPGLEVTLALLMYTEDEAGKIVKSHPIGRTYEYKAMDLFEASVTHEGETKYYLDFMDAFAAAEAGDTITLMKDVTVDEILVIDKDLTIVGAEKADGMYSITGTGKNAGGTYKTMEVYANLTLENVEVINNKGYGRPVDMRNDGITLNVINSKITATSAGNNQLITVGGNGVGADGVAGKTVVNISGSTLGAGTAGYGIISFNPVEVNISNASVSTGFCALYFKGISNSLGSKGSVINVEGSTLEVVNNSMDSNSGNFGLFVTEDENITLNVDATSTLKVEAKGVVKQCLIYNKVGGSSNVNIANCPTWMLVGENAFIVGGPAGIAGSTILLPNDEDGAVKYQLKKAGYDCMEAGEKQLLVIESHESVNGPANDIFAHVVEKVEAKAATCAEAGWEAHEACTVCDYTTKVEIPAKGHKMTKEDGGEPTCTEYNFGAHYSCETCGKLYKDAEGKTEVKAHELLLPAKGHTMTKTDAKAADCNADGNVEYYTCSVCKKTFADKDGKTELAADKLVVKSEGHKMTKTDAKAATYTADGNIEYYTCSVCGKLFADAEGAKAITAADTVIAKLPAVEIEIPVAPEKPDAPETDKPETEDKEEVTVPEVKVEVKAEVKEEAAEEIIEKAVEKAKAEEKAPVVTLEVKKEVVEAVQKENAAVKEEEIKVAEVAIPTATVEQVAKADEKAMLAVELTTATVIMDNKALETVAKEAEGKTVELKVDQVAVETLKEEQQAAVENKEVALTISATLICAETKKEIGKESAGGFGGGTVTVAVPVPVKLPEGVKAADLKVYYVADDGTVTEVKSQLKGDQIVFDLEHFSEYVIAAEKPVTEKPASPATGDTMNVTLYGVLAIMSVMGMAVVLKKKAF